MARIIFMTDFSEAYSRSLMLGIARYAHDRGEAWSICRLPTSVRDKYGIEAVLDYAKRLQVDAVIGQFYKNDNVALFEENGIIAIAQDFKSRFSTIPNITGEHYRTGAMGADYFLNKGFSNFAYYGVSDVVWADERYYGFKDTVEAAGDKYTLSALRVAQPDMWRYDFQQLTSWLLSLPKPVAIFACDDRQAYYITEACRMARINEGYENVRIPEDIALLGVDNDETVCRLSSPNLSSIHQDADKGGYDAARLIDSILNNSDTPRKDIVVKATYIVTRQSSDIFVNYDPIVARTLKYIHEKIGQKIMVDDIVAELPTSRRLLEMRFRKAMGTSIYDYIVKVRAERIAQLLCEGKTVSEAAIELGYCDIKNISRLFKQIYGVSPSEYRRDKI